MTAIRYSIVYGIKDTADRYLPIGEVYLRGISLEESKELFKKLPKAGEGEFVFRLYERYYDNHTKMDVNYKKSEFSLETNQVGFHEVLDALFKLVEEAMDSA